MKSCGGIALAESVVGRMGLHYDRQWALERLVRELDQASVPYAIVGAMALNEFGYQRTTSDVDALSTPDGLAIFKARVLGRGYVEKFPGSRGVRDTEHGVEIDVVLSGGFPGDGKPKPVAFPDSGRGGGARRARGAATTAAAGGIEAGVRDVGSTPAEGSPRMSRN